MKKLLFILPLFVLSLTACKDNPPAPDPNIRDYTSFTFKHEYDFVLTNCLVGYYNEEDICVKLGDLGTLKTNQVSREIKVDETLNITRIYFFCHNEHNDPIMFDHVFILKKKYKNDLIVTKKMAGDDIDPNSQYYPH